MSEPLTQREMTSTLRDRAAKVMQAVKKNEKLCTQSNARLLAEMANLLDRSEGGEITADEWEDHELAWQAYVAQTREAVVEGSAQIMLAFEAMARHEPEKITPEIAEKLDWWQNQGGRESLLGELPIEVRRRLEEAASKLPRRE